MSGSARRRPIPRLRVAVAGLALLGLLATIVAMGEVLRHPYEPPDLTAQERAGGDPRDEIICPEPLPREGQARDTGDGSRQPVAVSSNQLFDCPQTYDGQRVEYRGEVVGALLERGAGVWTQLNDDVYAGDIGPLPAHRDYRGGNAGVGVLLPATLASQIMLVGGPRSRGDVLQIRGIFHRVDATGEVAVIHAEAGQVASQGTANPDPVLTDRRIVALVAFAIAVAMVVAERRVAARR